MTPLKIAAIILIILGTIGLAYGGFTYTSDVHKAEIGSINVSLSEKEHVNIPVWIGVTLIFVGGVLLVIRKKS